MESVVEANSGGDVRALLVQNLSHEALPGNSLKTIRFFAKSGIFGQMCPRQQNAAHSPR